MVAEATALARSPSGSVSMIGNLGNVVNYVDIVVDGLSLVVLPRLSAGVVAASSVVGSGLRLLSAEA